MTRAAVLIVLAAVAAGPRAVEATCNPTDLAGRSAVRCVQAHLVALAACRRAGTPLNACAAQVRSPACDRLPADCRPAAQAYSIFAATQRPGPRDACRTRLARAGLKLLKRGLVRARAGTFASLPEDLAACTANAAARCDTVPDLGSPCQGLATREDAAACVCGLGLPVLPASVEFALGACPSALSGPACAPATGIHPTCHEAFTSGDVDDLCIAGHGSRAGIQPAADAGGSKAASFPIRPRGRTFHGRYPEATGSVSAISTGVGPAGTVVGASDQGHLRLTAPVLTTRLVVLRWDGGDLPDGATTQVRLAAGSRVLADVTPSAGGPAGEEIAALVSWQGDLDLTVSALASARRDRAIPSADLAWRLRVLDPTADDDVDGTTNARDPGPLERGVPASPGPSTRPRVLLVGLDGAGWDVLGPLIDAGYLPTIGALVRGGTWAKLDETGNGNDCCFCPPVWSSIATGRPRTAHHMIQLADEPQDRPVPAIWTALAAHGGTTTQVSYRNTFPVEAGVTYDVSEQGLVVAANAVFDTQNPYTSGEDLDRLQLTSPPLLFESLGILPASGPRTEAWITFAIDRVAVDALTRLAATSPTDLTMLILHSIDKSEHIMWASVQPTPADPVNTSVILQQAASWNGPVTGPCCSFFTGFAWGDVASQYLEADQHLARILAAAQYDYVLFASDHSMTRNPDPAGPIGHHVLPPSWDGIFAISGPGIVAGQDLGSVSLLDVTPTLAYLLDIPVADDLPGTVVSAAFTTEHLTAHPIRRVATWTTP